MSEGAVVEFIAGHYKGKEGTVIAIGFPTRVRVDGKEVHVRGPGELRPVMPFGYKGEQVRVIHGQLRHRNATVLFAKNVRHGETDVMYAWLDVPFQGGERARTRGLDRAALVVYAPHCDARCLGRNRLSGRFQVTRTRAFQPQSLFTPTKTRFKKSSYWGEEMSWRDLPYHVRRHMPMDAYLAIDTAEGLASIEKQEKRTNAVVRAAELPRGWLTFARRFFPVVVETEPASSVKSLVMSIWERYAATERDPWLPSYRESFRDLGRAYYEDGLNRRIIQFNNEIYRSDPRRDVGRMSYASSEFDRRYRTYEGNSTRRAIEDFGSSDDFY